MSNTPQINLWPIIDQGLNLYADCATWNDPEDFEDIIYHIQASKDDLKIVMENFIYAQNMKRKCECLPDQEFQMMIDRLVCLLEMHTKMIDLFRMLRMARIRGDN